MMHLQHCKKLFVDVRAMQADNYTVIVCASVVNYRIIKLQSAEVTEVEYYMCVLHCVW
jgi:hypothetical protein